MGNHVSSSGEDQILRLDGEHIMLREFIAEDLDRFHSLTWQPEIHSYLPGWNVSKDTRKEWLLQYEIPETKRFLQAVKQKEDVGELRLRLGIILKETGELIGWCCSGIKDELPWPNREIMYAVSKDHRGRGYAAQAAQAMIRYLFDQADVEALCAVALVRNLPSNRVLEKCGFDFQGKLEIEQDEYNSYVLRRSNGERAMTE
ncbi:GNAT family N-acetyltransferase [Paenibacillus sp. B01]|uniref:GNAT family N-acetyltransferase n=1 Tax=Paenibacillus sp. B01 TaxID=2660554 RepID=UPI00129B07D3|nr:GNAT family N-acetyltransferase [Paenibacillus sp. B01]QGG54839.1 GNAT family N-acetyltransferase [Paenibacillus sp. B01]